MQNLRRAQAVRRLWVVDGPDIGTNPLSQSNTDFVFLVGSLLNAFCLVMTTSHPHENDGLDCKRDAAASNHFIFVIVPAGEPSEPSKDHKAQHYPGTTNCAASRHS